MHSSCIAVVWLASLADRFFQYHFGFCNGNFNNDKPIQMVRSLTCSVLLLLLPMPLPLLSSFVLLPLFASFLFSDSLVVSVAFCIIRIFAQRPVSMAVNLCKPFISDAMQLNATRETERKITNKQSNELSNSKHKKSINLSALFTLSLSFSLVLYRSLLFLHKFISFANNFFFSRLDLLSWLLSIFLRLIIFFCD